jgi:hypothetical protein
MIDIENTNKHGRVSSIVHKQSITDGEEYELQLINVDDPLYVKIAKEANGKFVPSQSFDIFNTEIGAYSSSNHQDTEDKAMNEVIEFSLAMFDPNKPYTIAANIDY